MRRLTETEARFDPLLIDAAVARSYGMLARLLVAAGRRAMDLFTASTAHAHAVPLFTRNPDDFTGLDAEVDIVAV